MSVMIGGVTERVAPDSDFITFDNVTGSNIVDVVLRDAARVKVAAAVTFLSGIFQVKKKSSVLCRQTKARIHSEPVTSQRHLVPLRVIRREQLLNNDGATKTRLL